MYKINIVDSTPLAMLTVGQFREVLAPYMVAAGTGQSKERRFEYGLRGIAKTFDCSIPTALRLKNSGKIDAAISQIGRKIVIDADLALELAGMKANGEASAELKTEKRGVRK